MGVQPLTPSLCPLAGREGRPRRGSECFGVPSPAVGSGGGAAYPKLMMPAHRGCSLLALSPQGPQGRMGPPGPPGEPVISLLGGKGDGGQLRGGGQGRGPCVPLSCWQVGVGQAPVQPLPQGQAGNMPWPPPATQQLILSIVPPGPPWAAWPSRTPRATGSASRERRAARQEGGQGEYLRPPHPGTPASLGTVT